MPWPVGTEIGPQVHGTGGCSGAPRLVAAINGSRVLSRRVPARRRWTVVWATGAVAAGTQRITLRLANPHRGRECRRRLRVDRLVLSAAGASNPAPSPSPPASGSPAARWVPAPRTTWQWQLTGTVDQSVDAQMFDIDLFDNSASVVAALHARGRHVVCYVDAGTYEQGRPDSASYPAAVRGKALPDWPGEQWLDVRRLDVLGPILGRRLDLCKEKGFDAVEPDNIDGYANDSGFPLTAADQLRFNRFLADAAHARGLSIGLKNDLEQAAALQPSFDWALNEQCFQYDECDSLRPFALAGKAVFIAEYELAVGSFCPQAQAAGYMAIRKRLDLDAWRETCW
jgi:glycosyl hydrolase family 114